MHAVRLETVTSTNDAAMALVRAGAGGGWVCVRADAQTHGRGTHGRAWHSPPNMGIYLSVGRATSDGPLPAARLVTLAAGAACADAIETLCGLRVWLRPVNDIYCRGGKLGGILTEALVEDGQLRALVIGVGVNVRRFELPAEFGTTVRATSLEAELPADRFRALAIDTLADELAARLQRVIETAPGSVSACAARA